MKHRLPILVLPLILCACADTLYPSMVDYMTSKRLSPATLETFPHCQNYDCAVVKNVRLGKRDWSAIKKTYGKKAGTAAQERDKIARTIGVFEQIVGPVTKTDHDREGTFLATGDGQLDCVDESTNTAIYLTLLDQMGLIRFHTIEQPQVRYPLLSGRGWMHQTAVITEKKTGAQYAVDSWYEDNGRSAYIVPMEEWRAGWHPRPIK